MGEVLLANLTSLIVKWLREVEMRKIVMIFLLKECLWYEMKKELLIDLTGINLKQLWEAKKVLNNSGAFNNNISYF